MASHRCSDDEPSAKRQCVAAGDASPAAAAAAALLDPTVIDFPADTLTRTATGTTAGMTIDLTTGHADSALRELLRQAAFLASRKCGTPISIDIKLPAIVIEITSVTPQGTFLATIDQNGCSHKWHSARSSPSDTTWLPIVGSTLKWDTNIKSFLSLANPAGFVWVCKLFAVVIFLTFYTFSTE
jgi:hypothetical protein